MLIKYYSGDGRGMRHVCAGMRHKTDRMYDGGSITI
jgi:hypothetical protein